MIFEVFAGPPQPGVEHSGTWCGAEVAEGPGASDLGLRVQGLGNIVLGLNRWEGGGVRLEILCPLLSIFGSSGFQFKACCVAIRLLKVSDFGIGR